VSNAILLIFEGKKTEPDIFDNIKKVFFNKNPKPIFYAIWDCDILSLYKEIKEDRYLDTLLLLQEKDNKNKDIKNLKREDISQIFMFFDFEGRNIKNKAQYCDKLKDMLEIFNNETEQGKLYLSYPMVEALKHAKKNLSENELNCIWNINGKEHYKTYIGRISNYTDSRKLNFNDWQLLISLCIQKAYCLVYEKWKVPTYKDVNALDQTKILNSQKNKFIIPKNSVISLSAFPFFILNYFGEELYEKLKCQNYEKKCKFKCIVCKKSN